MRIHCCSRMRLTVRGRARYERGAKVRLGPGHAFWLVRELREAVSHMSTCLRYNWRVFHSSYTVPFMDRPRYLRVIVEQRGERSLPQLRTWRTGEWIVRSCGNHSIPVFLISHRCYISLSLLSSSSGFRNSRKCRVPSLSILLLLSGSAHNSATTKFKPQLAYILANVKSGHRKVLARDGAFVSKQKKGILTNRGGGHTFVPEIYELG